MTHDGVDSMYSADNNCKMNKFLSDNMFLQFGGCIFHQLIRIPMGATCALSLAELILNLTL